MRNLFIPLFMLCTSVLSEKYICSWITQRDCIIPIYENSSTHRRTVRHATIHKFCIRQTFLVLDSGGWPVNDIKRKDELHISVYRHYVAHPPTPKKWVTEQKFHIFTEHFAVLLLLLQIVTLTSFIARNSEVHCGVAPFIRWTMQLRRR